MPSERITITLPGELVEEIDRRERNRSKFVREAIQNEIERRKRAALRASLRKPHSESEELAELGLEDWAAALPEEGGDLVDPDAGTPVEWRPGEGWSEVPR